MFFVKTAFRRRDLQSKNRLPLIITVKFSNKEKLQRTAKSRITGLEHNQDSSSAPGEGQTVLLHYRRCSKLSCKLFLQQLKDRKINGWVRSPAPHRRSGTDSHLFQLLTHSFPRPLIVRRPKLPPTLHSSGWLGSTFSVNRVHLSHCVTSTKTGQFSL